MSKIFLKIFLFISLIYIHVIHGAGILGRLQSVGAKGTLLCNRVPASNVELKLYDVDRFDIDDLIAQKKSDNRGYFEISGSHKEFTNIDPKLNIYHNCNTKPGCLKKVSIIIPDRFISKGDKIERWYDTGVFELSGKYPEETESCAH